MRLSEIVTAEIRGGYFYDDQAAVRAGAKVDGEFLDGQPVTPGFTRVRQPAVGVGIGFRLEAGALLWGDAIGVQYPGVADRDPPLDPGQYSTTLVDALAPLVGTDITDFRSADLTARELLRAAELVHTGLEYGVSQALLAVSAVARGMPMAAVICREFSLPPATRPVPIFAQSGERRHANADKMIMKQVDVLPHGLINNVEKFGDDGSNVLDYTRWLVQRIKLIAPEATYSPTIHLDLYGVPGEVFGLHVDRICDFLAQLEVAAQPYPLRVETPIIAGSRRQQIDIFGEIRRAASSRGLTFELVADEWCNDLDDIDAFLERKACDMIQIKMPDLGSIANSIEAVLRCRAAGVKAYLGGSSAETEVSARVAVHVAVATQADVQLAKPGMGVDEGLMIVANEQTRLLAELATSGVV